MRRFSFPTKRSLKPEVGFRFAGRFFRAFTLVELLVVMAIIVVLLSLIKPAFNALSGANSFSSQVGSISGIFEQARAYAVSNNTYVFVGIAEVDATQSPSTDPQVSGANHYGRVTVAAVASKTGVSNYDASGSSVAQSWSNSYTQGVNLSQLDRIRPFENLHLSLLTVPTTGAMARPAVIDPQDSNSGLNQVGNPLCVSSTLFVTPLGKSLGSGQYQFKQVVQFDPQGTARIVGTDANSIPPVIEIGLQPTHGNQAPAVPDDVNTTNLAAIQIDGMTGAVHIYRP